MHLGRGLSAAGRGDWTSALAAMREWGRLSDVPTAAVLAYGLAVTGAHLGSVDPSTAAAFRPERAPGPSAPEASAEVAWLDGVLAHARGDSTGLAAARAALQRSAGRFTDLLDRSLAAFARDLDGDATGAARALAALEWESAERQRYHGYAADHPFLTSIHRLTAARGLLSSGDTAQAERLLTWTEAVLWNLHGVMDPGLAVFAPLALFERARIAEARGRSSEAADLYGRFLERYDRPEGQWTGRVEEAVGAVAR
jgi:hypothetical protein